MADLLAIGKSAVAAQQKMLSTTSNNISNVSTQGYVRQRSFTYTNITGYGVGPTLTQRVNNEYQQQEVWRDTSNRAYYETVYNELYPVDQYLSSSSIGMSSSITGVFTALQSAVNNPSSTAERSEAVSKLQDLSVRFNTLNEDITKAQNDNQTKIDEDIQHINDLLANISNYNSAILAARNKEDTETYNLMDQRDAAITELASYIDIRTYPDDDDSNVTLITMASGQSLLLEDGNYAVFEQIAGNPDPSNTQLSYKFVNTKGESGTILNSETIGGELGGLLESRGEIKDVRRQLGQLAISMGDAFNSQNKDGLDLNGEEGKNLFNLFNSQGSNLITTIGDTVTGGSLKVSYVEGSYDKISTDCFYVTADISGMKIYMQDSNGGYTKEISQTDLKNKYGLEFNFTGTGSFFVDPTLQAASTIKLAVDNSESLALAGKYRTTYDSSNKGTGVASIANYSQLLSAVNGGGATIPLTVNATSATGITVGGESFTLKNGEWYNGAGVSLQAKYGIKLEGTVSAGDKFAVGSAVGTDVSGDNSNGLMMCSFESSGVVRNGTSDRVQSFAQRYSTLTGTYGSAVNSANTSLTAAEAKLTQSRSSYESTSSVSLDEEAANLVQYQQYYTAAAKIITASQTIFQALISAV